MGVLDIYIGGKSVLTRLIHSPKGGSVYQFTLFQPENMPGEVWENQGIPNLIDELKTLKHLLENN